MGLAIAEAGFWPLIGAVTGGNRHGNDDISRDLAPYKQTMVWQRVITGLMVGNSGFDSGFSGGSGSTTSDSNGFNNR